jgi:hypothetical protein
MSFSDILTKVDISFLLNKRTDIMYLILILMIGFGILMAGMILNASYRRQIRRLKEYEGRNKL